MKTATLISVEEYLLTTYEPTVTTWTACWWSGMPA